MTWKQNVLALLVPAAALAAVVTPSPAAAAESCKAKVSAQLTRKERKETFTVYTYTVSASTMESCAKVRYTLHAAHDLGIINPEEWRVLDSLSDEAGRCLWALCRSGPKGRAGS